MDSKTIKSVLFDLLRSSKVQFFFISQLTTLIVLVVAAKLGVDPKVVEDLLFVVFAKAGVEAGVLQMARARVDAQVSSARITASANESIAMQAFAKGVLGQLPGTIGATIGVPDSSPPPATSSTPAAPAAPVATVSPSPAPGGGAAVDPT